MSSSITGNGSHSGTDFECLDPAHDESDEESEARAQGRARQINNPEEEEGDDVDVDDEVDVGDEEEDDDEVVELDDEESSSMMSDDLASFASSINPGTVATHLTANSLTSTGRKLDVATLFAEQRRFEEANDKVKVSVALDGGPPLEVFVSVAENGLLKYTSDGNLEVTCASGVLRVAVHSSSRGIHHEVEGAFSLQETVRLDAWTELNFVHDAKESAWRFKGFQIRLEAEGKSLRSSAVASTAPLSTAQEVSVSARPHSEEGSLQMQAPSQTQSPPLPQGVQGPAPVMRGPPGFASMPAVAVAPPLPVPAPGMTPPPMPLQLPQQQQAPQPMVPINAEAGFAPTMGKVMNPNADLQQQQQQQQQQQPSMMWFPYGPPPHAGLAGARPGVAPYFMYMPSAYAQMPLMYPGAPDQQGPQPSHPQQQAHMPPPHMLSPHHHHMLQQQQAHMHMPMMPMMPTLDGAMSPPTPVPMGPMMHMPEPEAFETTAASLLDEIQKHSGLDMQELLLRSEWGRGRVLDLLRRKAHPDLYATLLDRIGAGVGVLLLNRFASQVVLEILKSGSAVERERLVDLLDVSAPALMSSTVACNVLLAAIKDMRDEATGKHLLDVILDNVDATELLAHPRALTLALATHSDADERVRAALSAAANPVRLATSRVETARTMVDAKFVDPAYVHVLAHHELGYTILCKDAQLREACVERLDLPTLAKHALAGAKLVQALLDEPSSMMAVAQLLAEAAPSLVFDRTGGRLAEQALRLLLKRSSASEVPNHELLALFEPDVEQQQEE
ncbi:Hypothetical Protein FCC1311_036462 [Hondaea fermentalgiana]|uniref:Uncharacterized protein n=1 Tax=Hondaea fermentalgiana TaxID=2315210 RepID=A0A2R5GA15_9STRA|nr:Hypothetical Protein FCC1311_036462 [Hondaea fermentalgiana]|eukprot:GBG27425.1 Hypothetical Protein FCC1311_036462 [Hondaea fermentalgiana]